MRAVIFAHHDVGVRCLAALHSAGIQVPAVFVHQPDPGEQPWYASVESAAREAGVATVTTENPNVELWQRRIAELDPDFLFSFYYRSMLTPPLLRLARRGALNMHGSLLPRYRGRAPVNWAILSGETWTGATLHYMVEKADAGDVVDQLAVPILQNDEARDVFAKVTIAAETILARSLPALMAGSAPRTPQNLADGAYFGRRRPEDGLIDWRWPGKRIHDLVRALAPPFPGAFADIVGARWWIYRTRVVGFESPESAVRFVVQQGALYVHCTDGAVLQIVAAANPGSALELADLVQLCQRQPLALAN